MVYGGLFLGNKIPVLNFTKISYTFELKPFNTQLNDDGCTNVECAGCKSNKSKQTNKCSTAKNTLQLKFDP